MGRQLEASRAEGSSGRGEMGWTLGAFKGKAKRTRRGLGREACREERGPG